MVAEMETVVFSGINLYSGGTLSVYKDALKAFINSEYYNRYHVIAFVHKKKLFSEFENNVEIIEKPKSRKSYFIRMYYEYMYFNAYSKKNNIHAWISMHDMTPNVKADKIYTYCHNSTPFYKPDMKTLYYSPKVFAFSYFYKFLYRINIHKASAVIVQQRWLKDKFTKMYGVKNIIVAKPNIMGSNIIKNSKIKRRQKGSIYKFIYPALPRVFKNFEVICEACKLLTEKYNDNFQVILTIDPSMGRYSKSIWKKYKDISQILWVGLLEREDLFRLYNNVDCLIFPSKLETYGMPIEEFKRTNKSMLVSRLPYAYETVGDYEKVRYFLPDDAEMLARYMHEEIAGTAVYQNTPKTDEHEVLSGWEELFSQILAK